MFSKNFNTFRPNHDSLYDIGATQSSPSGVLREMAEIFNHDLAAEPSVENLGELIGLTGQSKTLQDNIDNVTEVLNSERDAVSVARDWVERSGLLVPVERDFMSGSVMDERIDLAVVTGGVRNWMHRRINKTLKMTETINVEKLLLVGGNRKMRTQEGPDVEEGDTEFDYMERLANKLKKLDIFKEVITVGSDSGVGDEVMVEAAKKTSELVNTANSKIVVVSNAGAWWQNAGQFRRALRNNDPQFDQFSSQFYTVSDEFALGSNTDGEKPVTHQNPFTALGMIARNAQEICRHVEDIPRRVS